MSRASVRDYYRAKTGTLLEKYGPGPRVHFHVGFADAADATDAASEDPARLRRRLVAAQEAVLEDSARVFAEIAGGLDRDVLDVGCGLGGGALYLASHFGARVTALTPVADHARRVRDFARAEGVADRVRALAADAHAVPARAAFDLAVAIESSCYLDRPAWFAELARVLRPGGHVFVIDGFLGDPGVKPAFDAYWHTDVAPLAHYADAAARSGFVLQKQERLNPRAIGFWELSRAWTRARLRRPGADRARLERSLAAHARWQALYAEGGIEYLRLSFRHVGGAG